ncbi:polymer-forming cytoskeletal protein [Thiomicrorhabdus indica]|uniref:bactofilin family protein n=1 Tax=Thiomicrorhabdus indica TaxID=2267253 RepID=UPI002AA7FE9D|nr:polymer-forming cytoskeletal protein [Thiomicrorhabdus indica]
MGIFRASGQLQSPSGGKTIITRGTKISGELEHLEGDLHLDGALEGVVKVESDVSVGRTGQLTGLVKCQNLFVSGHVDAKVACQTLEILPGGQFNGEVICHDFIVDEGGEFNGQRYQLRDEGEVVALEKCLEILKNDQLFSFAGFELVVDK